MIRVDGPSGRDVAEFGGHAGHRPVGGDPQGEPRLAQQLEIGRLHGPLPRQRGGVVEALVGGLPVRQLSGAAVPRRGAGVAAPGVRNRRRLGRWPRRAADRRVAIRGDGHVGLRLPLTGDDDRVRRRLVGRAGQSRRSTAPHPAGPRWHRCRCRCRAASGRTSAPSPRRGRGADRVGTGRPTCGSTVRPEAG